MGVLHLDLAYQRQDATRRDFAPPAPPGASSLAGYFSSCAHFWMAAVSLGFAFSMHFEYFSNCAELGLLPVPPEPPLPPEPPEEPEPPDEPLPPRPPSAPWSSEIGFGFGGGGAVCGAPTFERGGGNGMLSPSAARDCGRSVFR